MPCVDIEQIEQYLSGELEIPERSSIEAHLASCEMCRGLLSEVEENSRTLRQMRSAWQEMPEPMEGEAAAFELPGYEIVRVIHEGGQGVVYEARQKSTKRPVALKLLLHGRYASRRARRRFEREIDLAASLDHPNIVTVFDSGTTDDGRLFLVMRYVQGQPLDRYVRDRALNVGRTLELFTKVASAVSYAHQRGVIHRDLKPNNILIDEEGEPHLLDFGLAKPFESGEEAHQSVQTQVGDFVGTLAYAAPEQVGGDPRAVDVRSDVYALGVILFEALTGRHPYPIDAPLLEVARNVAQAEPARPSSIRREIDDELDTIVVKTLSKQKDRRYQSVAGLIRDLGNYRSGRPIEAKGDNALYLLRKTLRRHRVPVAVAAVVILSLAGAAVISTVFWQKSVSDRRQAEEALAQVQIEANKASAVNAFLLDMLSSADPRHQGRDVTVREVLDGAGRTIDDSFSDQPLIEAAVRSTIGATYRGLGFSDAAEPHVERALEIYRGVYGEEHPDTLSVMNALTLIYIDQGRFQEAETLARKSLGLHRQALGGEDPRALAALNNMGLLFYRQGKRSEAESAWRETLDLRSRILGPEHPDTITSMSNLAWLLGNQGHLEEAERLYRSSLEVLRRSLGAEHPETLKAAAQFGRLYITAGRYEQAVEVLTDAHRTQCRVLGSEHPDTIYTASFLAWAYNQLAQYETAEPLYLENLATCRRVLGSEHPLTLHAMNDLAILYDRQKRLEEAEPLKVEVLETRRRVLGNDHPDTLDSINNLAVLYQQQGRLDEAEELFTEALATRLRVLGEDSPQTVSSVYNLGWLRYAQGRLEESEQLCLQALELELRVLGPSNPQTTNARHFLASLYLKQERLDDAEAMLLEGYEQLCEGLGAEHRRTRWFAHRLELLYEQMNRPEDAGRFHMLAESDAE